MKSNESGFSTPLAMTVIFSLSLIILSFAMLISANEKTINSYKRHIFKRKEAEALINKIEEKMQDLKYYSCDSFYEIEIKTVLDTGLWKNIKLKDVSTGINRNFIKEDFLENEQIKKFINSYGEEAFCEYGWINQNFTDNSFLEKMKDEFGKEDLFPLVNNMPLYNVYYMDRDFLEGVLSYYSLEDFKDKTSQITDRLSENLSKEDLSAILGVPLSNPIFNLLGTKTSFWEIYFETDFCNVTTIFAAVPKKTDKNEIEKYILIEKKISYKGGSL